MLYAANKIILMSIVISVHDVMVMVVQRVMERKEVTIILNLIKGR